MSNVYESLKEVVQETLQRNKTNPVVLARVKGSDASTFNDELEKLEQIVGERIGKLKASVRKGEEVVEGEIQHAEQLIESLTADIAVLEAKLKETRETISRNGIASQKMEESLNAKIHDLQSELKRKEESLESRGNEIKDFKSQIDVLGKQATQSELAMQQAKAETAREAERTKLLSESSKVKIAVLESQLNKAHDIVRGKDSTIKELEQSHTARIQDLESQVRNKEKILVDRDRQVNDLKSQVEFLTHRIKDISSFFRQAEGLAAFEAQDLQGGQPKSEQEKSAMPQFKSPQVTSSKTDASQEPLSPDFFDRITLELTEVIGPMASVIVRDHVAALGESMEQFTKTRVTELINIISEEIQDENVKNSFRQRFALWPLCGQSVGGL